eukprot:9362454-Pyramimonas_sp.AAC.1
MLSRSSRPPPRWRSSFITLAPSPYSPTSVRLPPSLSRSRAGSPGLFTVSFTSPRARSLLLTSLL